MKPGDKVTCKLVFEVKEMRGDDMAIISLVGDHASFRERGFDNLVLCLPQMTLLDCTKFSLLE